MAIEITPKRRIKSPIWAITLSVFCLILLFALIGDYFYLNASIERIKREIKEKESALMATSQEKALENNLNLAKNKINAFSSLISKHRKPVNIFTFLESVCLPNVQFSNFDFSASKSAVSLSGKTDSFISLEQQILVFKKEPLIKKIELSNILMSDEGTVDFVLILTFNPKIFR